MNSDFSQNAFIFVNNGHYPVYDAMLRETEKAVEHLKKLAEGMRGNQTSVEDLIQKLEKNKTETSKKIDEVIFFKVIFCTLILSKYYV